jgi:hypothetical protein
LKSGEPMNFEFAARLDALRSLFDFAAERLKTRRERKDKIDVIADYSENKNQKIPAGKI